MASSKCRPENFRNSFIGINLNTTDTMGAIGVAITFVIIVIVIIGTTVPLGVPSTGVAITFTITNVINFIITLVIIIIDITVPSGVPAAVFAVATQSNSVPQYL